MPLFLLNNYTASKRNQRILSSYSTLLLFLIIFKWEALLHFRYKDPAEILGKTMEESSFILSCSLLKIRIYLIV